MNEINWLHNERYSIKLKGNIMKTVKPAKLLVALILGLGSLTLVASAAYADNGDGKSSDGKSSDGKSSDGKSSDGTTTTTPQGCTSSVVSTCGTNIIQTVCSGSATSSVATDDDKDHDKEKADSDKDNRHSDDDHHGHHQEDDDHHRVSEYSGDKHDLDFGYKYDSDGNFQECSSGSDCKHVDHSERVGESSDGKITICHRMGGAAVTLNVPDDQVNGVKAHGHGDHDFDTIGRCDDDSSTQESLKLAAHGVSSTSSLMGGGGAVSQAACLSSPPGTPVTVNLPNGGTWTGNPPGCNANGISCTIPVAIPNSGGIRTLR